MEVIPTESTKCMDHENNIGTWAAGKRSYLWLCSSAAEPCVCLCCVQVGKYSWIPHPEFLGFPDYPGSYPFLRWSDLISVNNYHMRGFVTLFVFWGKHHAYKTVLCFSRTIFLNAGAVICWCKKADQKCITCTCWSWDWDSPFCWWLCLTGSHRTAASPDLIWSNERLFPRSKIA